MSENDAVANADWGVELAARIGRALAASDDTAMLTLLDEVDQLLASERAFFASVIAQAALFRAAHGTGTVETVDVHHLLEPERLDEAFQVALRAERRSRLLGSALGVAGRLYDSARDFARAVQAHEAAAAIWAALGDGSLEAQELLRAGTSAYHVENPVDALARSALARAAHQRVGDVRGEVWALVNMAQASDRAGDLPAAQRLVAQASALSVPLRDAHLSCSVLLEEGVVQAESGQFAYAGERFQHVYRSARRRRDWDQALVAAKNLGLLHADLDQPQRAVAWWRRGAALAGELSDWREHQDIERIQGVALAGLKRFEEATASLRIAIQLNETHGDPLAAAQSRADLGGIILEQALRGDVSEERFAELTREAINELDSARSKLETQSDFDWAAIAVRNLRTAWTMQNTEADGALLLQRAAEHYRDSQPHYAAELSRVAAWLALSAGASAEADVLIAQRLVDAVAASSPDGVDQAWSLAKEAATLAAHGFDHAAGHLYDAGLARLSPDTDPSAFGNILNDSVLVLERLEQLDEVRERLLRVEIIARRAEDRVLLSLALSNLAETASRQQDDAAAREYFLASIDLAAQIGDHTRVALGLSSIANSYAKVGDMDAAERFAKRAMAAARTADSEEAWLHATSANASVAYLHGDYEAAFAAWDQCASRAGTADADDYPAFALDCLAQLGDWPRFRQQLDRYTRRAQASRTQSAFVNKLHLSVLTWLSKRRFAAAGTVLAYGVLLAFEGVSGVLGAHGRALSTAEREQAVGQIVTPLGSARAVFTMPELSRRDAASIRRAYERTVRRAAGDTAASLLQVADEHIFTPDDVFTRDDESDSRGGSY